ncbi:hypothetical protein EAL2_c05730 [Peptoclostridium acidaminophilum DSM 3953]|jgi:tagatose-1,6-bisphosphate aldolase|uniref:Uncharacterized protein n=1 Tax=Peptoclostridium acidaminophilum DSM 3953 TaxID=1286171 RepID=W8T4T6_PEPAC|nr:hypothetical protein [Peptoclostridium acidaminophilum]AHM55875.1 hypothetical protein EAL2_c05730 [Peptoclostridium acidaminophilum DSM 3953]
MSDPYEDLANAIVLLAVKDYRDALKKLMKHPRHESAKRTKAEVERFLRSDWYRELTAVEPEILLRKLKEEVKQ